MGMGQSAIRAGKAFVELLIDNKPLVRGLRAAQRRLKAFGAGVQSFGRTLLAGGAAIAGPIIASVKQFISAGDQLDKMAKRTGVSVEALSELGFAAEQSGAGLEPLEKGVRTMQRTVNDAERGLSTAKDAFDDLGLSIEDLEGLSPEAQFKLIADRLSKIEDPTKRAALAMMIFGRAGTQLLPMLADGAAGIEALQQQARDLGLTISTEAAADAAKLGDTLNELWRIVKVGAFALGAQLAPMLIEAAKGAQQAATRGVEWIKQNRQAIVTVTKLAVKVVAAGAALVLIGGTMKLLAGGIGGFIFVVKALGVAFTILAAHPVLLALTATVGVIAAIGIAADRATVYTAKLSDSMSKLRARGDELRATDLKQMRRLEELAKRQDLSNDEMEEADRIIQSLGSRYGDLGLSVDHAAQSIDGMTGAMERLLTAMRQPTIDQLDRETEELRANVRELLKEIESREGWRWNPFVNLPRVVSGMGALRSELAPFYKQIQEAQEGMRELQRRKQALLGGETSALTGAGGAGAGALELPFELGEAQTQQEIDQWLRRVHQLRLQQIADEQDREIALLDERYDHELKLADRNSAAIQAIEEARQLETQALRQRFAEQEAAARARLAELDADQLQRVEELRLRAGGLKDEELQRKLLDLQERHALENAREQGLALDLVRQEFELRRKMLDLQEQGRTMQARMASIGTFRGPERLAMGVQSAAKAAEDKQIKVAEDQLDTAGRTESLIRRLVNLAQQGGLTFT